MNTDIFKSYTDGQVSWTIIAAYAVLFVLWIVTDYWIFDLLTWMLLLAMFYMVGRNHGKRALYRAIIERDSKN